MHCLWCYEQVQKEKQNLKRQQKREEKESKKIADQKGMKIALTFETKTDYVLAKSQIQEIISIRQKFPIIAIEKYDNAEFTQDVFDKLMNEQAELGFILEPIRRHIYACETETVFCNILFK